MKQTQTHDILYMTDKNVFTSAYCKCFLCPNIYGGPFFSAAVDNLPRLDCNTSVSDAHALF